ncbi:Phosphoenolpyruvate synthase regulatory protein, partial [hydrothermal vent metagenome]
MITRPTAYFHLHLVSDATGETLNAIAKAVTVQFATVSPIEHVYPLVRTTRELTRVLKSIEDEPGIVLFTLVDDDLRQQLEEACRSIGSPAIAVLDPVHAALRSYLGAESTPR